MSPSTLERKSLDVRVKCSCDDGGPGTFSVYASVFDVIDRQNEMVARGAFKNLDEFVRDGFMALGHDHKGIPIGTITSAVEDGFGLLVSGDFHSHPAAQDARRVMRERMDRGKGVKLSIGYVVREDGRAVANGKSYRVLKGIDLIECSWVNIPANSAAVAVAIKGFPGDAKSRELRRRHILLKAKLALLGIEAEKA